MKCPGQDRRYWQGNAVFEAPCPECGCSVEIFRDENSVLCRRCGHRFLNPGNDFGCARWCSLARECLGFSPQRNSKTDCPESALAARLIQWVEQEYKSDPTIIAHALKVFQYAKDLVKKEGGDPRVVLSASIILATGAHKYGMAESLPAQSTLQLETMFKVNAALQRIQLNEEIAKRICDILISCKKGEESDTVEFQIVCDSNRLAELSVESFSGNSNDRDNIIRTNLRTEAAKDKARGMFHN